MDLSDPEEGDGSVEVRRVFCGGRRHAEISTFRSVWFRALGWTSVSVGPRSTSTSSGKVTPLAKGMKKARSGTSDCPRP